MFGEQMTAAQMRVLRADAERVRAQQEQPGPFNLWVHEQDGTLAAVITMSRGCTAADALAEADRWLDKGYRVVSDIPQAVAA